MGDMMLKIIKVVERHGGLKARMRLATKTGVSSRKARQVPDDHETIKRMVKSAQEILNKNIEDLLR